jgi:hypothetical protein
MIFRAQALRFEFEARDAVWFPPNKAGNTFRGALGSMLPEGLFSPRSQGIGPSGFEDRPRPFVLRAATLDGRRFEPGERFALEVNVFDPEAPDVVRSAFEKLDSLGPHRARVALVQAIRKDAAAIDLAAVEHLESLRIHFLTPMELKFEGVIMRQPGFEGLLARVRDRISSLCALYQGGAPDVSYRGLGQRSRAVTLTAARIEQVEVERRSSRTGLSHTLGGFVGEADYEGPLGEFLPWLRAAEWTGAGRYTVWGNGALRLESAAARPRLFAR